MNKSELVSAVAEKAEITKKSAGEAVDAILAVITEAISNQEDVAITGFGTWKVVERAARKGFNPQTKEEITIPARNAVSFKAGKTLKDSVKNA